MKNDLICQSSEYDCGPTTLVNGIRYLFDREEIPPAILKHIWTMGNDTFSDAGELGKHGTSKASMCYMACWFNAYAKGCGFPLHAEFLEDTSAVVEKEGTVTACLQSGGCALVRCFTGKIPHYVLLTKLLPGDEIGLFDPYDEHPDFQGEGRRVVTGEPKAMNRAVRREYLNLEGRDQDYAMGPVDTREILLMQRTEAKRCGSKTKE
ncbi:MAG: peptidase C39 [Clostridia bacterium]|nr:peptidase C39 [Clostridia bacterium]